MAKAVIVFEERTG